MQTGGELSTKPCQEFKPCMKLRGTFDYTELIPLRGKEREWEGLSLCPYPHPWQSGSSEQTDQMKCGRQTSTWPLGILLSVPDWLAARSVSYDSRGNKRNASLSGEGGVWGCLSRWKTPGTVVAWAEFWLSELSDIATLRSTARWLGFEVSWCDPSIPS